MQIRAKTIVAAAAIAATISAGMILPASAGPARQAASVDAQRLDSATAEYSYYRGRNGWRGGRGAAVAGAVGIGVLGAAAIAASRPAYAETYDGYDDGYTDYRPGYQSYEPAYEPVYEAPVYARPHRGYGYRGYNEPRYRSGNGTADPARGGR